MTNEDLKALRARIKFSMADIAACLGVPKSTYQRYEDSSAPVPAAVERAALELENINRHLDETRPARIEAHIRRDFPYGVPNEVRHEM